MESHRPNRTIVSQPRGPLKHASIVSMLAVAVAIVAHSSAVAQQLDTLRLTADDAVEMGMRNAPELIRSRLAIERARAGRLSAGGFFPELPEIEMDGATDAPFDDHGDREWEVSLNQEIDLGGRYFVRRDVGDAAIAQAESEVRGAEIAYRAEIRMAHARLLAAQERLRLVESLAGFARRLDTIASRQLDVGEIAELDRNFIHIERARTEIELANEASSVASARLDLALLLGDDPIRHAIVAVGSDAATLLSSIPAIVDSLAIIERPNTSIIDDYFRSHPERLALDRALERVRLERRLAGRQIIPNLRLGLGLRSEADPGHGESRLLTYRLGIQVPLPFTGLYDVGAGEIALADVEAHAIEAEMRVLDTRLRNELARAIARLRSAAAGLRLYDAEIVPLVQRNIELLDRGYTAGELTATQVVTQQDQLLRAGEAAIEARLEFMEALVEFRRAAGRE